ncbi:hypothetical protein ACOME3_003315 [Neoechinorhynchus agilis]
MTPKVPFKHFVMNIITSIMALLALVFLWAAFIYFSNELRKNVKGLRLSSAFGAAIAAFFILTIVFLLIMGFPLIAEYLMESSESAKEPNQVVASNIYAPAAAYYPNQYLSQPVAVVSNPSGL